jgi:hypothetical protein
MGPGAEAGQEGADMTDNTPEELHANWCKAVHPGYSCAAFRHHVSVFPAGPDPIIVARDEALAEVAIQMHGLSKAQRITMLDILSLSLERMQEALVQEEEADGCGRKSS